MLQLQTSNQKSPEAQLARRLITWAENKLGFHITVKRVYRGNYSFASAEALRQQSIDGNFDWLPTVRCVNADSLGGANSVYDTESATLFFNIDLADSDQAAQTFVEEVGHHLDTVLNITQTGRDEVQMPTYKVYMEC